MMENDEDITEKKWRIKRMIKDVPKAWESTVVYPTVPVLHTTKMGRKLAYPSSNFRLKNESHDG